MWPADRQLLTRERGKNSELPKILAGWVVRLQTRFLGAVVPAAQLPTHCGKKFLNPGCAPQWAGGFKFFRTRVVVPGHLVGATGELRDFRRQRSITRITLLSTVIYKQFIIRRRQSCWPPKGASRGGPSRPASGFGRTTLAPAWGRS